MFDSDFITNPYGTYTYLRAAAPLHWADKFRSGAWLVTRYADVLAGLHDARLSSQRSHTLTASLPLEARGEFGLDGGGAAVSPRRRKAMRPAIAANTAVTAAVR
jgi:cytochrome P450